MRVSTIVDTVAIEFEWDEATNAANIKKHGLSFATASRIFEGTVVTRPDARHDYGEVRERSFGVIDDIWWSLSCIRIGWASGASSRRDRQAVRRGNAMTKRYDKEASLTELAALPDQEIDFSDIPEADDDFWKNARVHVPYRAKTPLNVRIDSDVVDWFRSLGKGYQTRMNAVLRTFYEAHRDPSPPNS
ncbi:MAG: BrnA antitoxin family protein [Novosphingobium sp.]